MVLKRREGGNIGEGDSFKKGEIAGKFTSKRKKTNSQKFESVREEAKKILTYGLGLTLAGIVGWNTISNTIHNYQQDRNFDLGNVHISFFKKDYRTKDTSSPETKNIITESVINQKNEHDRSIASRRAAEPLPSLSNMVEFNLYEISPTKGETLFSIIDKEMKHSDLKPKNNLSEIIEYVAKDVNNGRPFNEGELYLIPDFSENEKIEGKKSKYISTIDVPTGLFKE